MCLLWKVHGSNLQINPKAVASLNIGAEWTRLYLEPFAQKSCKQEAMLMTNIFLNRLI